ncbi:MAG: hypothetical protein H7A33_01755 [Deltaproteobacteria bacterium]|nr:hypothetical protein [Deltaproteobacteria bacterium]
MQEEFSLQEYLNTLRHNWKVFVAIILIFATAGSLYSALSPRIYRTEAMIFPDEGGSSFGGGFSAAAQMFGLPLGGGTSQSKKIQLFLKSFSFAKAVVSNHNLSPLYLKGEATEQDTKTQLSEQELDSAAALLKGMIKTYPDSANGSLQIIVDGPSAEIAFRVNQTILTELKHHINREESTEARQNRIFIGKQLLANERELLETGKQLSSFGNNRGLSAVSSTIDLQLSIPGQTPASLEDIQPQLNDLMKEKQKIDSKLKTMETVQNVPQQAYLEYLGLKKQILVTINTMLSQQFEFAKIEEQRKGSVFQIIDHVRKPSGPFVLKQKLIFYAIVALGILLALAYILVLDFNKKKKTNHRVELAA